MYKNNKLLLSGVLNKSGNNFDLLRILAAFAVIFGHGYAIAPQPPRQDFVLALLHFDFSGSLAVKFFFFLSGLLVTGSILKRPEPFQFLVRRIFRIFPGLIACLLVAILIVGPLFTKLPLLDYFTQKETWTYFSKNIGLVDLQWRLKSVFDDNKYGLNGSLWTLQFELLCYFYVAIFCAIGVFSNRIVANIIFLAIVACSFLSPESLPRFSQNPEAFLLPGCFAIGALFSLHKNLIVIGWQQTALLWLSVFLVTDQGSHRFLFYIAFFYTSIFFASRQIVIARLRLRFDASYGVYVYGFMIQQCLHNSFPEMGVHGNQFYAMLITLVLGAISWYVIEKPAIDLGTRLTSDDFWFLPVKQKLQSTVGKYVSGLNRTKFK